MTSSQSLPVSELLVTGDAIARLEAAIAQVVRGKTDVIRLAVVTLLAEGHLLIEDVPGVGKTTLAQALARSIGAAFQRIQFTSDLLPSDIIGVSVFQRSANKFEFVPGPLFANIVLADEINRATPKTQSALLEAMSERKVSVERQRYSLPAPFLVLATQNPLEHHGTFPLPESQLDRFLMALEMGYPPHEDEKQLLKSGGVESLMEDSRPVLDGAELVELQARVRQIHMADKLVDYIMALVTATRTRGDFALPVSTRGAQGLYRATQDLALVEGRDYGIPDDVQRLVLPVFAHRVLVERGGGGLEEGRAAMAKVLSATAVPI